ncbi:hypothetical protein KAR91_17425 [Candidatus Pacearchaeota archaeon]|nr:hypothetical protein [Candidatus Pacearchaeota archaeon]
MTKKGVRFWTEQREVTFSYMDLKGKDAGVARYRIDCYYADGRAFTHFTYTAKQYYSFIAEHISSCYETYEEFKARKTNEQAIDDIKRRMARSTDKWETLKTELQENEAQYTTLQAELTKLEG